MASDYPPYSGYVPTARSRHEFGAGTGIDQAGFFCGPIKRHCTLLELDGQVGLVGKVAGGLGEPPGGFGS